MGLKKPETSWKSNKQQHPHFPQLKKVCNAIANSINGVILQQWQ
jgi:hypothetical protein